MTTARHQQARGMRFTLKSALATLSLLLGLAMASPAAAVQCGDTIGPNQTVTLQSDLYCDDNTGGLIVIGPAEVNMNSYDIRCVDTNNNGFVPTGLVIFGQKAHVYGDGTIDSCFDGVVVDGEGRHTVETLTVQYSRFFGFFVSSSKNTLRQNYADQGLFGFLTGDHSTNNKLFDNTAANQDSDGFVIEGNKHQFRRNVAFRNAGNGLSVYGVGHTLTENQALSNLSDGFDVQEGEAEQVTLRKNLALKNGKDGFEISGQKHKLTQNTATKNETDGIDVHDASRIVLKSNEALDNNQGNYPGIFDLKDQIPTCGTNTWRQNIFGTTNQPCIQ